MTGIWISLVIFVGIVALCGWLTVRALRSSRTWVKIVGGVLGAAATFLFLAIVFVIGRGAFELFRTRPVATVDVSIVGTPEQIARGEHLASFLCASCHSQNGELPLTGGNNLSQDTGLPLGDIYAPNITPAGRIQNLSDADLFRILRTGVEPTGRLTAMAFFPVRYLSDDDAMSIIAYLRNAPSVAGERPPLNPSPLLAALVGMGLMGTDLGDAPIQPVSAPPKGVTIEYGEYIANFGDCRGCHGEKLDGNAPPPAPPGASNLTVVVPNWSRDEFIQTMRTGVDPTGHKISPPMPWQTIGKMDDVELAALYEYLHALTPLVTNK